MCRHWRPRSDCTDDQGLHCPQRECLNGSWGLTDTLHLCRMIFCSCSKALFFAWCSPAGVSLSIYIYRQMNAYICNFGEHWFAIRKIGRQWFNLNSLLTGPELLSDTFLRLFLTQLQQDGEYIFIAPDKKEHYKNRPIQICRRFHLPKLKIFRLKISDIFHISAQNIKCGHLLEQPQQF